MSGRANWARDSKGFKRSRMESESASSKTSQEKGASVKSFGADVYSCKHNLQYWHNLPYLGFGAGAHGYAKGVRYSNTLSVSKYINALTANAIIAKKWEFPFSPATIYQEEIEQKTEMQETMMLGLRLTQEGVSAENFQARFDYAMQDVFGKEIDELLALDLLEWAKVDGSKNLRLTPRARILGNQVFYHFVE